MLPEKIDRYKVIDLLGRGGMATVYKAEDPRFDREVAVKVLPPEFLHDPSFKARFAREAKTIAKLEHNAIVPVYDFGEQADQPYLVMRCMPGGSLKEKIEKGPLTPPEANKIILRIADALDDAASKGIVHRDLKPANVLFDQYDDAYLADFGIAKMPEAFATITGSSIVGTPSYMSPEQAQGEPDVDHTTDIYALGVILFEMLTGSQPYQASTPMGVAMKHLMDPVPDVRTFQKEIPSEIGDIIQKAMAKDRKDRYQSASEMASELNRVVMSQTLQLKDYPASFENAAFIEKEIPPEDLKPSFFERNKILVGCGGISLVLMCAALLFVLGSCNNLLSSVDDLATSTPAAAETLPTEVLPTEAQPTQSAPPTLLPPPDQQGSIPYRSVVQISAMVEDGGELFEGWTGSGSIISPDGHILTNAHVVLSDRYFEVQDLMISVTEAEDKPPTPKYYAEVMQADEFLDIAVIRITHDLDGNPVNPASIQQPFVPIGNSNNLTLGDGLVILGYPGIGGDTITLTRGEVSGFTAQNPFGDRAFVKTSATIAGGNSGGLAANAAGQLIGVPTQLGYGGDDQFVDCRVLIDTNRDGVIDDDDSCIPTGGYINALRPIELALPLIDAALRGEISISQPEINPSVPLDELPLDEWESFYDDFSDKTGGWDEYSDADGSVSYIDEKYEININIIESFFWSNPDLWLDDVIVDVWVEINEPTGEGDLGVICRYMDNENFYGLEISEDGYASIWKYENGEFIDLTSWEYFDGISPLEGQNKITGACIGDTLTLLYNDEVLLEWQDSSFSEGDVGLVAGTWATEGLSVYFDDFSITIPPEGSGE